MDGRPGKGNPLPLLEHCHHGQKRIWPAKDSRNSWPTGELLQGLSGLSGNRCLWIMLDWCACRSNILFPNRTDRKPEDYTYHPLQYSNSLLVFKPLVARRILSRGQAESVCRMRAPNPTYIHTVDDIHEIWLSSLSRTWQSPCFSSICLPTIYANGVYFSITAGPGSNTRQHSPPVGITRDCRQPAPAAAVSSCRVHTCYADYLGIT